MKPPLVKAALAATALALTLSALSGTAQADDWSGPYAGVQLGFGVMDEDFGSKGTSAGIQVGQDWQFGDWVVGLGFDAQFTNGVAGFNDFESLSRAKFRGGYAFGDTLAFVCAGASYANHYDFGTDWGDFVGVGLEHKVSDNWSVSGEVVQHRFDDFNGFGKMEPTVVSVGFNYRF